MFGLLEATEIFQGSTERTWNCVLHYIQLFWSKLSEFGKPIMPKSRKRHHSRSRSKSRSHSRDRSRDREDKYQKNDSYEKDRDGKRRKIDMTDSPHHRKSVSSDPECAALPNSSDDEEMEALQLKEDTMDSVANVSRRDDADESECDRKDEKTSDTLTEYTEMDVSVSDIGNTTVNDNTETTEKELISSDFEKNETEKNDLNDSTTSENSTGTISFKSKLEITPKKILSPRQVRKTLESEKKRQERQREREDREKKRNEEKMKKIEEKQKELEQKQKEKELKEAQKKEEREKKEEQKRKEREEKEDQKRKEREEKEQKRKDKEEKEEQKRKERELEKLKKQSEIDEKKKKEEEKRQKVVANFVNFFVAKKSDSTLDKKSEDVNPSAFMAFEIKSDMRLPPQRRKSLTDEEIDNLDKQLKEQTSSNSYLAELKCKNIGTSSKTWPFQETLDDDVVVVEDGLNLGEDICEDTSKLQKFRAKFLKFHENRRPAYYGTWRKKSKSVTGRRPFAEDNDMFTYEEDSDDDWEEEEQGESLNGSDDEEKETEEERDEYEVDNEFFVPHGHLSDDEVDDDEKTRLSPESLKQKLKLLKDEFDQDMKSKTHKLKSRSVGCIWYKKDGSNIEEAIDRYLQPFKIISNGPIQIKDRSEIFVITARKCKQSSELNPEYIPLFLKVIHGNPNKKIVLIEQFITYMANEGIQIDLKPGTLIRKLKQFASWKPSKEKGRAKNRFLWLVKEDVEKKYNVNLVLPNFLEGDG